MMSKMLDSDNAYRVLYEDIAGGKISMKSG